MLQPAVPLQELKRLSSLKDTNILNTAPEAEFDNIAKLASYICKTPISLISLISENKQWFKSKVGTTICDAGREVSFCGHTILEPEQLMEVKDTRKDERFKDNPFAHTQDDPILFYAGVPLLDFDGLALGTLCVLDTKVNKLDHSQKEALKALGKQVEMLLELHRKNNHLEQVKKELNLHNKLLKNFAANVSHDIKMPLASMIITTDILKAKYSKKLGPEGRNYLHYLKQSSLKLSDYVNGVLNFYESDSTAKSTSEEFELKELFEEIIDMLHITEDCEIILPDENEIITTNHSALEQIFLNLLGNSIKYNNKEKIKIEIDYKKDTNYYYFIVKDNGIGIPEEKQGEIFRLFTTLQVLDRRGNKGKGIGLSTVKKLVKSLGGTIKVQSVLDVGTTFTFSIKRTTTN